MTDDSTRYDAILARLEAAEWALATYRGERLARRHRGRSRRVPTLALAILLALVPAALLAADPVFSDLGSAGETHRSDIQAIGNAGITTGFADPANPGQRLYDPQNVVTREQMASFLARTAGLGANPPVANALTANTATNAMNAVNATTAQNATNATNAIFAASAASAQDAAQLGGIPAASYLQSGANVSLASLITSADAGVGGDLQVGGSLRVGRILSPQFRATRLINSAGPLPITRPFTTGGGILLVVASGSGFSTTPGQRIGMRLTLDGGAFDTTEILTNEANSHKAFATIQAIFTDIPAGSHTIVLSPLVGGAFNTSTDFNDIFLVTVIELPFVNAP